MGRRPRKLDETQQTALDAVKRAGRAVERAARSRDRAEETLQEAVREARRLDVSLRVIGDAAGVSRDTVDRWAKGE